ncbi:hypothetical protein TVAG_046660 [Trichomonas vaginalis G3]|uniref:Uncharacterized protein n=1 Tax=Trichomonas vaginalis (strain ATCC PRA-98 / G3) TaxID=412133 RepID=A2EAP1_TRIV3|nr:hypothetical protein TVAGG3_0958380 [Trichomonas vaginalis G3]EAY10244.1 hypothetical protein TVAG_046660 [Trichomonas vaginalis G3]KAI5487726.1 hypothetical protein TVAGG3_0958380 [Trichomonas vaginalis G3]|eukprot:XP_001322467.1 hypothetical protein [Trichomonas vaginalis G3]
MADELVSTLSKRQLVSTMIGSDCLQSVLSKMCDFLQKHEDKIYTLLDKIEKKVENEEYLKKIDEINQAITKTNETINHNKQEFTDFAEKMQKQLDEIVAKQDRDQVTVMDKIDETHKALQDQVQAQHLISTTSISKLNQSITEVRTLQTNVNNDVQEMRELLKQTGISTLNIMMERLDQDDDKFDAFNNSINNIQDRIEQLGQHFGENLDTFKQQTSQDITRISRQLDDIQTQFMTNDKLNAPVSLDDVSEADITPLILAVHRDTRRLDGVDQQISSVRLECENISGAMENAQVALQKFNHSIYDFQCQLDGTRNEILSRFQLLDPFFKWLGANVRDLWSFLQQVGASTFHVASSSLRAQDDLYNLISTISTRPLPPIHSLDEIIIESSSTQDQLHERRMNVDFEKQFGDVKGIFKKRWKTPISKEKPNEIPDFKKTLEPKAPSALIEKTGVLNRKGPVTGVKEDPMLMITLEEIRVKINKFEQNIPQFTDEVQNIIKSMSTKLDTKMAIADSDRLFETVQHTLNKLQTDMDNLKVKVVETQLNNKYIPEDHMNLADSFVAISSRRGDLSASSLQVRGPHMTRPSTAQSTKPKTTRPKPIPMTANKLASDNLQVNAVGF